MANFRPLQPAPMDQEPPPLQQSRPLVMQKPKRTVTLGACIACRKRKSKCDGSRPTCTCCSQKDTECVYEMGPHEKPSQAMKRKNEEMQGELSNLRQLYDFLRLRPEEEALQILRQIRDSAPDTSPSQHIKQLAESIRSSETKTPISQDTPAREAPNMLTLPPIRMALDDLNVDSQQLLKHLSYPPHMAFEPRGAIPPKRRHLDSAVSTHSTTVGAPPRTSPAMLRPLQAAGKSLPTDTRLTATGDWTDVTDDRDLLAHLMDDWHSRWEYRYYHILDWDIFLDDMASGRTDFCSKLLVNALLASASFHSPMVNDRSSPFAGNIITSFYQEAIRLWRLEKHDTLIKLQSAILLYMVIGKHGRDKDAHEFLVEACRMGREFGLFEGGSSSCAPLPTGSPRGKWETTRATTAWALFNFQLLMSSTFTFAPILTSQPLVPVPYDDDIESEALFRSECARQVIMLDISSALNDVEFGEAKAPPNPELIESLHLRLQAWWDNRAPSLDPNKNPSPENLLAAMIYYTSNIRLIQPFLSRTISSEQVSAYRHRARSISTAALKALRRLLTLHEVRQGWDSTVPYIMHPIIVTAFGCLDEINTAQLSHLSLEMHESYLGLLTCLRALDSISKYIYYAQPLFRVLTQTCQALGIRLPAEVMPSLEKYRSEEWTKQAANLVSSRYVADMRNMVEGSETRRMDAVIAQWGKLSLGEKGEGQAN